MRLVVVAEVRRGSGRVRNAGREREKESSVEWSGCGGILYEHYTIPEASFVKKGGCL